MQIFFLTEKDKRRFGDAYVNELIRALRQYKKDASGRLIKSIDYRLTETAYELNFFINAEDYLTYVDQGRKRGSYPPIKSIAKWASLKGLPKGTEFGIAKNIYKFGIKPTNILDKVERKVLYGKAFDEMETAIANNIETEIVNNIENNK
jgi:hypothetical protein